MSESGFAGFCGLAGLRETKRVLSAGEGSRKDRRSGGDAFQGGGVEVRGAFGEVEHFDADDLVGLVVIENDAGRDFFGFEDGGIVEAEVERVGASARCSDAGRMDVL